MASRLIRQIRAELDGFDGKNVSHLSEAHARLQQEDGLEAVLITLLSDPDMRVQRGASWILYERLKSGEPLSPDHLIALGQHLADLRDWQAALHILQIIDHLTVPADLAKGYATFAAAYLGHKRPFLRAWSMNALCKLAISDTDLAAKAANALQAAQADPAASVRARARRWQK